MRSLSRCNLFDMITNLAVALTPDIRVRPATKQMQIAIAQRDATLHCLRIACILKWRIKSRNLTTVSECPMVEWWSQLKGHIKVAFCVYPSTFANIHFMQKYCANDIECAFAQLINCGILCHRMALGDHVVIGNLILFVCGASIWILFACCMRPQCKRGAFVGCKIVKYVFNRKKTTKKHKNKLSLSCVAMCYEKIGRNRKILSQIGVSIVTRSLATGRQRNQSRCFCVCPTCVCCRLSVRCAIYTYIY